jgi:DNA polymerase IV
MIDCEFDAGSRRGVLCADLDAMYAAIEARERGLPPDRPIVVGGDSERRGVVSTCNYAARAFGVRSAMPAAQARRLCPDATFLSPRHSLYSQYSRRVMAVLGRYGPLEQVSIDEAFVEIGRDDLDAGLGQAVKAAVLAETGLVCSVGLATNKLVAKIASSHGKPDGLVVVSAGDEATFLAPLAVGKLWGVGPKTVERLRELGILLVSDLAALPPATLRDRFGAHFGAELWAHARGIDDSPVVTHRERKQLSEETTFARDVADRAVLWHAIRSQARDLARRLAADDIVARTVSLKLRYGDFSTLTRALTRIDGVSSSEEIAAAAGSLVRANWQRGRPVRLIGVGLSRFEPRQSWRQLPLPGVER